MKSQLKFVIVLLVAFALIGASFGASTVLADDTPLTINLHNNTADEGTDCPDDGGVYWHFVTTPNNGHQKFVEFHLELGDGVHDLGFIPNGAQLDNVFVEVPAGYSLTDLVTAGSTADILWDGVGPDPGEFKLSHVCTGPQEELTVSKTADTSYTRTHKWDIAKSVDTENGYEHEGYPKIWLYVDGSGDETATWTVDVSYEGYDDSGWNVSGKITIENTGDLDATIDSIYDVLAGTSIIVDCGVTFPYLLPVGDTLICTYSEDGYVEGINNVTVTTENDSYNASADIIWGDPTTEINKTVTVKDLSDLFGEVELGTVTAPNDGQFTYTKDFAWADYGADHCGDFTYDNTATIVETDQSASATLKVNVQCYIYETAYAKGSSNCFIPDFSKWGWSNQITPGTYTWDLWAGAAQCDTGKGTLVGTVTVVYDAVTKIVTVTYNVGSPYLLKETHVYAGYGEFPLFKGTPTVAPGQYKNGSPFNGSAVYVIAHAVVGIPDPNFGP